MPKCIKRDPDTASTLGYGFYTLPVLAKATGTTSYAALTSLTNSESPKCFSANSSYIVNQGSVFHKTA